MEKIYRIYQIKHNDEIIYVGCTTLSLDKRKKNGYKYITKSILNNSNIELLEETTDKTRERYYILKFRNEGYPLVNIQKGYGYDNNEYMKDNFDKFYESYFSEYWKKYKKDNRKEYNEYMKNYMRTYNK